MSIKTVHKSLFVSSYSFGVSICAMQHVLGVRYLSPTLGATKPENHV